MARQVVDPALLAELRHAGVDEGVARARLLPRLEQGGVPGNWAGCPCACVVEVVEVVEVGRLSSPPPPWSHRDDDNQPDKTGRQAGRQAASIATHRPQGICLQMGLPTILSKLGTPCPAR